MANTCSHGGSESGLDLLGLTAKLEPGRGAHSGSGTQTGRGSDPEFSVSYWVETFSVTVSFTTLEDFTKAQGS